jgi:hypothetical protein
MDTSRHRRARAAAIEMERESREVRVRRIMDEAQRNVSRLASAAPAGGIRYSDPVETDRLVFKAHDPEPEQRGLRRRRSEPAPSPPNAEGIPDWQIPWEQWLRAHLENERERTDATIFNAVRQVIDATVEAVETLAEGRADSLKSTRDEIASLRLEVAKFASLVEEVRSNTGPVDLPRVPLRSLREVN